MVWCTTHGDETSGVKQIEGKTLTFVTEIELFSKAEDA